MPRGPGLLPQQTVADGGSARKAHAREIAIAIRNSFQLAGSLALTWSVALIVKFQVPALLGPVRQGHFGFAESFAAMFFSVMGLGVDTYVVKEVSVRTEHASDFIGGVFALRGLLTPVLLALMAAVLAVSGCDREVQLCVAVFGATQLLQANNSTLAAVLQASTHVGGLAVANVLAKFVWGAGLLVALHHRVPLFVLALPMLVGELLRSAFLVPASRAAVNLRYRIDVATCRSVLTASVPFFVTLMAVTFGNNLALSTLEFIRKDEREVGWFSATQTIATLAMLLHPLIMWVVWPMLSRAYARSEAEMMTIVRRAIEALIVVITPFTVLISAGADIFVRLAFRREFAPAALGVSILSLVFVMTYLNIIMGAVLVIVGRSWTMTVITIGSIVLQAVVMLGFVPGGRAIFGTGGECAGAAATVILSEACVNLAMLSRLRGEPLDRRNLLVLVKSVAVSVAVLVVDHQLRQRFGPMRLVLDMILYAMLALSIRIVRIADIGRVIGVMRTREP